MAIGIHQSWPSVFAVFLALDLGIGAKFSRHVGGTRPHQSNPTASLAAVTRLSRNSGGVRFHKGRSASLTASLASVTRLSRNNSGVRLHKGRSISLTAALAAAARPASFPRRIAPTFATGNGCPAVCLVRIEIFRRWRGGVVAFGVVRTIDVKG